MGSGFSNKTKKLPNQNFAQISPKTVWRSHLAIHRPTFVLIYDLSAVQIGNGLPALYQLVRQTSNRSNSCTSLLLRPVRRHGPSDQSVSQTSLPSWNNLPPRIDRGTKHRQLATFQA